MEPNRNRRLSRRRTPKRTTRAICLKGSFGLGRNLALSVLDFSETGIRLVIKEALVVGQEVEVSVEGVLLRQPVKLPGVVVWCTPTADGTFCVGVHFEKTVPFSTFQALVSS